MELTMVQREKIRELLEHGNNLHKICRTVYLDMMNITLDDLEPKHIRTYGHIQDELEVAIMTTVFKDTRESWHKWRTVLRGDIEKDVDWKLLREKVLKRDICCVVTKRIKGLVVHHIDGLYTNNKLKNLVVLFARVHDIIHGGFELDSLLESMSVGRIKRSIKCYKQGGRVIKYGFVYDWAMTYIDWLRDNGHSTAGFKKDVDGLWRIFLCDGLFEDIWSKDGKKYLVAWKQRLSGKVTNILKSQGLTKNQARAKRKRMTIGEMQIFVSENQKKYRKILEHRASKSAAKRKRKRKAKEERKQKLIEFLKNPEITHDVKLLKLVEPCYSGIKRANVENRLKKYNIDISIIDILLEIGVIVQIERRKKKLLRHQKWVQLDMYKKGDSK